MATDMRPARSIAWACLVVIACSVALSVRSWTEARTAAVQSRQVSVGIEAVARQFKLDFTPLIEERFDLLVWRKAWFDPPFQNLLALCRSEKFHARAKSLGGYDVSGFETVHFNGG